MDEDLIKDYIDREGFKDDTGFAIGEINRLYAEFKKLDSLKITLGGAEGMAKVVPVIKEVNTSFEKMAAVQDNLAKSTKATVNSQRELDKAFLEGKVAKQQYNAELKKEIEFQNAANGSIEEARAKIKLLTAERNKANLSSESGRIAAKKLNDEIDKQNDFIKANVDALAKQKINIGNYQGSAKIIVDAFERARVKVNEVTKSLGPLSPEAIAARKEFEALERITGNPQFLNISAKVGDTNKELGFFTQRLNELEDAGLKNSSVYKEVQQRLASLANQIGDTKEEIKALSSSTRSFDLFAGSVSFAADAFQTFAGVAQLAGKSEEDAAKAIQTLVAIQSVANGVKGIANELTTKGTAANKLYNLSLQQGQILFAKSSTAAQRFNAALKGIIVLAVIGFLVQLVQSLTAFEDKAEDAKDNLKKLNDELERNKKITKELRESADFDLKKQLEDLKQSGATKQQLFEAESKIRQKQLDLDRKAVENANEDLLREEIRQAQFRKNLLAQGEKSISKERADADREALAALRNNLDERKAAVRDGQRDLILFQEQYQTESAESASDAAKEAIDKQIELNKKRLEEELRIAEANRQAAFNIEQRDLQRKIDQDKKVIDDESNSYETRILRLKSYIINRKALIDSQINFELEKTGLTSKQIEDIESERFDLLNKLALETSELNAQLLDDTLEKNEIVSKDLKSIYNQLQEDIKKNTEKAKEHLDEFLKYEQEVNDKRIQSYTGLYNAIQSLIFNLVDGAYEEEKNKIQEQSDAIEEKKARDIEAVEQQLISSQEKADKVALIEAKSANEKEKLAKKEREISFKQAQFEKNFKIFQIASQTIESVFKIKAYVAELTAKAAANPFLLPLIPIAAAQIPLTIASGAISLAAAAAVKLPRYRTGKSKDDNYEGPAIVGDGGKAEMILREDGTTEITGNTPELTYVKRNDIILPDATKMLAMGMDSLNKKTAASRDGMLAADSGAIMVARSVKDMEKAIVKAIQNKKEIHVTPPSLSERVARMIDGNKEYYKMNGII